MVASHEKVSFLIAGVQKGGTTALFEYLREHPRLQFAARKEVHFFDNEADVDWSAPDYASYHAEFAPFDGRLRYEATPIYCYWLNSLERIAKYNPDMRLILLFRDPVQRAWSHWRMEFARGFETEGFSSAIRDGRKRLDDDVSTPGYHRVFSYVERGFYGRQVQRLREVFPEEQTLLLRSDDLKDNPRFTLDRICRFLDIEPFGGSISPQVRNVGVSIDGNLDLPEKDAQYLRSIYAEDSAVFEKLSGLRLLK